MSVLLVAAEGEVGEAVIARLVSQGDEVRIIDEEDERVSRWRGLGAHVASGSAGDADLVERAAQGARTIVVLGQVDAGPVIRGGLAAAVDRFVFCTHHHDAHAIESEQTDFVVLLLPTARWPRRSSLSPDALALAIDAADDLAGNPRMYVPLGEAAGWKQLGLEAPG